MLNGETLSINANSKHGCFVEILERIHQQLEAMLSYHGKVLVLRLDLHTYDYEPTNKLMSNFLRKLKKRCKRNLGVKRIGHIWAREIEKAKSQHYHLGLMFDGNKVRHPSKLIRLVETIWEQWNQPKPYTPQNCYYLIHRNSRANYSECFNRLSYLAKVRGKGYRDKTANDYSASQVPHKIDKTGI